MCERWMRRNSDASSRSGMPAHLTFAGLDKGGIVEHWVVQAAAPSRSATGNSAFSDLCAYPSGAGDVAQQVPTSSVSGNSMFSSLHRE